MSFSTSFLTRSAKSLVAVAFEQRVIAIYFFADIGAFFNEVHRSMCAHKRDVNSHAFTAGDKAEFER